MASRRTTKGEGTSGSIFSFQVEGMDALKEKAEKLGVSFRMATFKAGVSVAARLNVEIKDATHAPFGDGDQKSIDNENDVHSGRLKGSIYPTASATRARVNIGKGVIYAKPVIFGWPAHGMYGGNPGTLVAKPAYPWRILEDEHEAIMEQYRLAIDEAIETMKE
jgi:hypothetical protein